MRKIFIAFIFLVVLLVAAALILPSLVPASVYKDKITEQVSKALGRNVEIAGEVELSVFPFLKAKAARVKIANADGFSADNFATMDSLEAQVKLFPLFKKQVEITAFTLVNPIISLEKSKTGEVNWAFGAEEPADSKQEKNSKQKPELGAFKRDGRYTDLQISLGTFTLKNGRVNYVDGVSGTDTTLKSVNMKITMPGLDDTFTAQGDLIFNDMPLDLRLGLKTPKTFLNGQPAQIMFKLNSELAKISAEGMFTASELITFDVEFDADIPSTSKLDAFLGQNNPYGALTETARIKGNLAFDGVNMIGKGTEITLKSALVDTNFKGDFSAGGDVPTASGGLKIKIGDIVKLQDALGMAIPQLSAFNTLDMAVNLSADGKVTTGNDISIDIKGDDITANYSGAAIFDNALSLAGTFKAQSPSIAALLPKFGVKDTPALRIFGDLAVSGKVNGIVDALTISELDFKTKGGDVVASYVGMVKLGKNMAYNGLLDLDIASLRKLAAVGGTILAADTDAGAVYGPVSISGQVTGTSKRANFSDARIGFDELQGSGEFGVKLLSKHYFSGELNLQGLDLRPYQAALYANRPKGVQPWSKEPLNIAFLNLFDSDFTLNTPNIITSTMEMGESMIKTSVKNGVFKTNIPNVNLYGGNGTLDMELNGANAVPQVALDFTLNNVSGKGLLGAVAGFTKLTGNTGTTMSMKGAGHSQAEIMQSLNGGGNFELSEGIVSGIDTEQFISNINSLSSVLQSRALPAGIGPSYNTPFNKLDGLFSIKDGVFTVGDFALNANNVMAEGAGTLDLGQQEVDFSFRPRLKDAKGLAAFGIPIKFSGDFGGIKAGLDTDLMSKIVAARAKAEIQSRLSDQVGGDLGGIIGGLLGNTQPSAKPEPTQEPVSGQQQPATPPEEKPTQNDPLAGLLGDLLGTNDNKSTPEPEKEEENKEEDEEEEEPLDTLLKGLFGND